MAVQPLSAVFITGRTRVGPVWRGSCEGSAWAGPRLQSLGEGYPQGDAAVLLGSRAGCSLLKLEHLRIPGADLQPRCSGSRCQQQPAHGGGSDTCLAGKEEGVCKGGAAARQLQLGGSAFV